MLTIGLPEFDHTIQETNAWLHEISTEMGDPRRTVAYHALRGVLYTLRDRLTVEEVFDLAAQLPVLIRGLFFEGYSTAGKPQKYHKAGFFERVERELQRVGRVNPETATRGVFKVLARHVSQGEIEDIRNGLPHDLKSLWPDGGGQ